MRLWLIKAGEHLPLHPGYSPMRTGLLAKELTGRGHQVEWWSSTFSHFTKTHFFDAYTEQQVGENLRLRLVHGPAYHKNFSLSRTRNHRLEALQFAQMASQVAPGRRPDLILSSLPTLDFCEQAGSFAQRHKIPFLVDIRDMWPHAIVEELPGWAQVLGRIALDRQFRSLRQTCRTAQAITGITDEFVEWGLAQAGRLRRDADRPFFLSHEPLPETPMPTSALDYWRQQDVHPERHFIVAFFGAISARRFDLSTIVEAARKLPAVRLRIVVCGQGDQLPELRDRAKGLSVMVFPGWLEGEKKQALLRIAGAGLIPITTRKDSGVAVPNKAVEYLAARLPLISCLQGRLQKLIADNCCGEFYEEKNPASVVQAILRLAENPARQQTLAENGWNLYQRLFSSRAVYKAMGDWVESQAHPKPAAQISRKSFSPREPVPPQYL